MSRLPSSQTPIWSCKWPLDLNTVIPFDFPFSGRGSFMFWEYYPGGKGKKTSPTAILSLSLSRTNLSQSTMDKIYEQQFRRKRRQKTRESATPENSGVESGKSRHIGCVVLPNHDEIMCRTPQPARATYVIPTTGRGNCGKSDSGRGEFFL